MRSTDMVPNSKREALNWWPCLLCGKKYRRKLWCSIDCQIAWEKAP